MGDPQHISEIIKEISREQVELRLQDHTTPAFLEQGDSLTERIEEGKRVLDEFGVTYEQVATKLFQVINGPYKQSDGYASELYKQVKPIKEFSYQRLERKLRFHCPWDSKEIVTYEFTIARPFTEQEKSDFATEMNLNMIMLTYERTEGGKEVFDSSRFSEEEKRQYDADMEELEQIRKRAREAPTLEVSFAGILPHFIKEHKFFPSVNMDYFGPPEEAEYSPFDIQFLLYALGFDKKEK